jgi:hypothetical protein
MINNILFICLVFIAISCSTDQEKQTDKNSSWTEKKITSEQPKFSFKTIEQENGWGYEIYQDGKLFILQPHIPAVDGLRYFAEIQYAEKTAKFIIHKLEKGIIPPTISRNELDSLGVLGK